jgi:hypothetical protein
LANGLAELVDRQADVQVEDVPTANLAAHRAGAPVASEAEAAVALQDVESAMKRNTWRALRSPRAFG